MDCENRRSTKHSISETSYIPEITSLSNHVGLNTSGGEYVYLMGNNFGPASMLSSIGPYNEYVWYGTSSDNHETYKISNCEVIISHTKIRCTSLESKNNINRTSLRWIVKIEDQRSIVSENSETSYGIPEITSLSNHVGLNTSGGEYVYLMGNNFGPASMLSSIGPYKTIMRYTNIK